MKLKLSVAVVIALAFGATLASAQESARDGLRISVQAICPVTGEKLGEKGPPIKVQVGQEVVFVCNEGCLRQKIDPQHWATIHANIARAQQICPIMRKKLPDHPRWTIVQGQIIFVCCPPCIKKIEADPQAALKSVDASYQAWLEEQANDR